MKLRDVMTNNPVGIASSAPIREAAQQMKLLDVGIIPAMDGNDIIGLVTDRDITVRAVAEGLDVQTTPVNTVMTSNLFTMSADADVREAADLMESRQIRRLLVTDDSGQVVGICSLGDLAVGTHDDALSGEVLERVSEPAQPARG